jgi:hypothetical protein
MIGEEVAETIRKMIEYGVEGQGQVIDDRFTVNFTLIDNNKPKKYRDPVWLEAQYRQGERTMQDIATEFGITPAAVNQWLVKHDITTRPRGHRKE